MVRWPSAPRPPCPPWPPWPPPPPWPPRPAVATRVSGPVSSPMVISAILLGPPLRPLAPSLPSLPSPPSRPSHAPGTTGPASQSQPSQVGSVSAAIPSGPPAPSRPADAGGTVQRADAPVDGVGDRQHRKLSWSALTSTDDPLHDQDQQVPPHCHDRARRQAQAADVDDVHDVVAVVDVPVLVADAEIPALAGTHVPVPHAQDPRREREVHHRPAPRPPGRAWPSAKTAASVLSCTPCPMPRRMAMDGPKKTAWRRRRCSAVAAGSARDVRDRRQGRVADQLGIAKQPAGVVAEPAGVLVERAVLRHGQAVNA